MKAATETVDSECIFAESSERNRHSNESTRNKTYAKIAVPKLKCLKGRNPPYETAVQLAMTTIVAAARSPEPPAIDRNRPRKVTTISAIRTETEKIGASEMRWAFATSTVQMIVRTDKTTAPREDDFVAQSISTMVMEGQLSRVRTSFWCS